jgi:ribosomal protein S18 acetylase RimI-like enzyme
MVLTRATDADFAAIVELANLAYRGAGANHGESGSWCSEAGMIAGSRLTVAQLEKELATKPLASMLVCREDIEAAEPGGINNCDSSRDDQLSPLLGTVWLEPKARGYWYLGLLTVRPALQNRQLGRRLLAAAEDFAMEMGATGMRMTVVNVRDSLIAWYQRRGYVLTGETNPFPYDDESFGKPLRADLHFVVLEKPL